MKKKQGTSANTGSRGGGNLVSQSIIKPDETTAGRVADQEESADAPLVPPITSTVLTDNQTQATSSQFPEPNKE